MFGYVLLELYHFPSRLMILYSRDNDINLLKPIVACTKKLKNKELTFCPHCLIVFCIYVRTNSDFCPM